MLNELHDFTYCDDVCCEIEELTASELSFDEFITASVSSPAR